MMGPRCLRLFSILLLLSTFVTAWPWPRWLPELDALIVQRNSNAGSSTSATQSQSSASSSPSGSQSGSQSVTSPPSQSQSPSVSVSSHVETIVSGGHTFTTTQEQTFTIPPSTTSGSPASASTRPTFAASLPAGAITLVTPAVISGPQYYKVGDNVTFVFGYTNVLATPTAVDVLASGSVSKQTYTMAMDQKVGNATGTVIWDTGDYQATALADPLLTQMYTLIIYDAASNVSATAEPGYLAVYEQYTFGMYTPQPYTPLSSYQCATCSSGALSEMERMALTTVLGVSIITIMSFSWFVGGLAVTW